MGSVSKPVKPSPLFLLGYALFVPLLRLVYRLRVQGLRHVPKEGPVLLAANHVSYVDAVLLNLVVPRPVRFLGAEKFFKKPFIGWVMRQAGGIPVHPAKAKSATSQAIAALRRGEVVAIFPEGRLSRDGALQSFRRGFAYIATQAEAPIVPVALSGLWGSFFSHRLPLWKKPIRIPYPVQITFGRALPPEKAMTKTRQHILDMDSEAFNQRPELESHLAMEACRALSTNAGKVVITDYSTSEPKEMKAGLLLALSLQLAGKLKRDVAEKRVGIVLPPGIGASVANLAVTLAGKTPVNLNFTSGSAAVAACTRRAGITSVISAAPMRKKVDERCKDFPWPENFIDVARALQSLPKWKIVLTLAAVRTLPLGLWAKLFNVPKRGGDEEAAILFTSGSESEPKGVVLTHRNLLAQRIQIDHANVLGAEEVALANLPIFHSFGFTVTLWYTLLRAIKTVTVPTPLEYKKTAEAIEREQCTIFLGTPTFFRPYVKKVEPQKLKSLKWVIAGAEKTPEGFKEKWKETFGGRYLEGYGLTETSPVVAVNVPPQREGEQGALRPGSVGKLFIGLSARIRNPDTGDDMPMGDEGILLLRGASVFKGYLDDPERTAEAFTEDGWYNTQDLARFDDEGFLYIEGRVSRFSKIGGEMVPHGAVEAAIAEILGVADQEVPAVAVSARTHPEKGEELVLLTTVEADVKTLREGLAEKGFSNLWVPKVIQKVEEIPVLASGKLDLKKLRKLAEES